MNKDISWGRIMILLVVLIGVAGIFFWVGRMSYSLDSKPVVPVIVNKPVQNKEMKKTEPASSQEFLSSNLGDEFMKYQNQKYGFSFDFPATHHNVSETKYSSYWEEAATMIGRPVYSATVEDAIDDGFAVDIAINQVEDNDESAAGQPNGMDPESISNITLGGVAGKKFDDVYVVVKDGYRYQISPRSPEGKDGKGAIEMLQRITSTFRFIK